MAKVELTVPDKLSKIDPDLRDTLLTGAIREVASVQLREKNEDLKEAKKHVLEFEDKYKKNWNILRRICRQTLIINCMKIW